MAHGNLPLMPSSQLRAKGAKPGWKLKSACHKRRQGAILLLISSLLELIPSTAACVNQPQNDADNQSCIHGAPNIWKTGDRELLKAVATWTVLAAVITTIGAAVAGRMYCLRSQAPTTSPAAVPVIQAIPAAVPVIQAIPAAVQAALPVIPVVEGDDLDNVLARAPIPTISTSPLSWL